MCSKLLQKATVFGGRLLLSLALVSTSTMVSAQDAQPPSTEQSPPAAVGEEMAKPTRGFMSALLHNLGDDLKHMPRMNSVYFLVGGGALALGVHQEDRQINARLLRSWADPVFRPGKIVGSVPAVLGAGTTMYIAGRWNGMHRLQHLGLDEIEATLLSEAIVEGAKQVIRRDRPLLPDGTRQSGFSFPSGHATVTFAAATVLQQHLGYRAGVPTYLVASYVAISRLHDNRHFASDVAFGAATGIVIGRSVTWHGRNFYADPQLGPGRVAIVMTRR